MKSNNQAIFHIIVTQLGWGLFLALNARRPLACAPKIMTQRVHIPSAEYWSGHAVLTGIHNIGFYEELSKIIIKYMYSSSVKSDKVVYDIYIMASLLTVL